MELLYKIFDKARYVIVGFAALALGVAMIMQYDWAYVCVIVSVLLAIAADIVKTLLQRKLGIPVTYRENMFRFKKRK